MSEKFDEHATWDLEALEAIREHATEDLLTALRNYRFAFETASEKTSEDEAALLAVGWILVFFPGATLLREIIESSFPKAARSAADDKAALSKMAELVANGQGLKPASRQVVPLAAPGASDDAIAHRLRRKFRADKDWFLSANRSGATSETLLLSDRSRRLIKGVFERKAEYVGRPYAAISRKLKSARRDLESKLADWEEAKAGNQRRVQKYPYLKTPTAGGKCE
jgi:hypothetical protein